MTGKANTALSVLGKYVDGLHISVSGEPRSPVFEGLRTDKGALRASPRGMSESCSISGVPGEAFMLTTGGGGGYQFVLHNGAIKRLEVTRRGELPRVMIQFRAETLHAHDLREVDAIVEMVAGYFLESGFEVKVSKFDVALDFQYAAWRWPDTEDVVCRARKVSTHREDGR